MKKFLLILLLALTAGCAAPAQKPLDVKPSVAVEYKYVYRKIPDEMLTVPPKVPNIDVSKSTQKDVASWMVQKEDRSLTMENKLNAARKYNDDQPVDSSESVVKTPAKPSKNKSLLQILGPNS